MVQQLKLGLGHYIVEVSTSHRFRYTHTYKDTHTPGRTPLNQCSARRRGCYLQNTRDRHPCPQRDSNHLILDRRNQIEGFGVEGKIILKESFELIVCVVTGCIYVLQDRNNLLAVINILVNILSP